MAISQTTQPTMDELISFAKRRGFIFPSSEIYGGLNAIYDMGPLGVLLKRNIQALWWKQVVQMRSDMVGLDASILMNSKVWETSGHVKLFADPLVECKKCHQRFRADHLLNATPAVPGHQREPLNNETIKQCPQCGGELTEVRMFNTMFKTNFGPVEDESSVVYLRPETAQGMFVNFKNVWDTARVKMPFGIAQIGKAFRNEITTGNFIFRLREFEQMEIEYFVRSTQWEGAFEAWLSWMKEWMAMIGLKKEKIHFHEIPDGERAHYSKRTIDIEYDFPFGQSELYGLAYRTDFDLVNHSKGSGQPLSVRDPETNEVFTPHVIEPTFGVERTVLAVLLAAYTKIEGGRTTTTESAKEVEVVLRLPKALAPMKAAVLPLSKKEPLTTLATSISTELKKHWMVAYDDVASIGRRYRRQDEIGTPYCITIDFDSVTDNAVTVRDRDTMAQERVKISELVEYLRAHLG